VEKVKVGAYIGGRNFIEAAVAGGSKVLAGPGPLTIVLILGLGCIGESGSQDQAADGGA